MEALNEITPKNQRTISHHTLTRLNFSGKIVIGPLPLFEFAIAKRYDGL